MTIIIYLFLFILLIIFIYIIYYSYSIEVNRIETIDITINIKKIKNNIKILHLSDFHLYKNINKKRFLLLKETIIKYIKENEPDIIFLTGDYIDDNSGLEVLPEIFNILKAKYGIYAVLGNHDYYVYNFLHIFHPLLFFIDRAKTNLTKLIELFKQFNIKLLFDESEIININGNIIEIIGFDALSVREKKKLSIEPKKTDNLNIVLSHYPDIIREIKDRVDIVLSGHTHGGQITIFGYPLITRSKIKKSHVKGVSIHNNTILNVSKGVGVSRYIPFRFFAYPDFCYIEIKGT